MDPYESLQELLADLAGVVGLTPQGGFKVLDGPRMAGRLLDRLVWTAVFSTSEEVREASRWIIRAAAVAQGATPASTQSLYDAAGRGDISGFTVPAHNLRGLTYEVARALFRAANETGAGLFIFEIARSEIGYTEQRPAEYTTCVLAAALREGWKGPVFLQGDHYQFNAKKTAENPQSESDAIRALIKESIDAGFFNIDIDSSTLVDLGKPSVREQQRQNSLRCAEMTEFIRKTQAPSVTISIGGEIGEVGKQNSTVEEFEAFMDGYREELDRRMPKVKGISKISVQTGTQHGGAPRPDGTAGEQSLDVNVLRSIGKVARTKYGLGGTVQHGASTLPDSAFPEFPRNSCVEIHLATQFQNLFFDHPSFPRELREEMSAWIRTNLAAEFKTDLTPEQNLYRTRKKAYGPFKKKLWMISDNHLNPILASLERKFVSIFRGLNVVNTKPLLDEYVRQVALRPTMPESLRRSLSTVAS